MSPCICLPVYDSVYVYLRGCSTVLASTDNASSADQASLSPPPGLPDVPWRAECAGGQLRRAQELSGAGRDWECAATCLLLRATGKCSPRPAASPNTTTFTRWQAPPSLLADQFISSRTNPRLDLEEGENKEKKRRRRKRKKEKNLYIQRRLPEIWDLSQERTMWSHDIERGEGATGPQACGDDVTGWHLVSLGVTGCHWAFVTLVRDLPWQCDKRVTIYIYWLPMVLQDDSMLVLTKCKYEHF